MPQSVTIRRKNGKISQGVLTCETRHDNERPPPPTYSPDSTAENAAAASIGPVRL